MAKKKVSLYIEDAEIKLLVSHGNKIDKWASLTLEPSLVRDGAILDEAKVAEAIRELFQLNKVSEKKINVALSGLNSIFRVITLPELPAKLLPEAVINEASRVIPMPLEEVYLAHQTISSGQGEIRMFLTAYPRASTDTLMRTLAKAGLKATVLDLAPLALARCASEPRAIIVNTWMSNLDIVIMNDRLPQVVRSISLAGEEMSNEDKIQAVVEEFNRTVSFFNSSFKENSLNSSVPVFACGDLTQDEQLWQSFNLSLMDYTVSTMSPPIESPEGFIPCQYMVNIGLALKSVLPRSNDASHSIIDFNALPEAYIPPSFSWYRILVPVTAICAIGGLFYFWLIIQGIGDEADKLNNDTNSVNAQANLVRSQINPIKDLIDEQAELIEAVQSDIDQTETHIGQIQELTGVFDDTSIMFLENLEAFNHDLPEIYSLAPEGVTLSSVSAGEDSFNISGFAISESSVYDYARALRSSERFNAVEVASVLEAGSSSGGSSSYSFSFVVQK